MENKVELTQEDVKSVFVALNTIKYICEKSKHCKNCPLGYMENVEEHNCMLYRLMKNDLLPVDWCIKEVPRLLDTTSI
ncbi:hypothetical protein [Clostridioides sp. ZZV15-6383]|uniref:hypothetical protein n=1 Tax=unclassified Clostridioides TaxID=2635829 RepID=UPI001D12F6B6|nr:hypothetical protein [Clostridioides sp. ZZV15-6597]MCC0669140.1 hypothetical protein [Clostridioides sp. ZZV14-6153]MCC0698500.1 hypothetical protein [Clostridioides sp. ZZV15-6383]MCC0726322.1 hypothetical protein [Clostridioides sp. ZZV14-6045]MCC0731172.1 hypothetical protein [Clostridioides sp. ZZV14-6048]MCC0735399.1 hypothetical protein [Clostridioides sp. ZZV14-6009]MCC0740449.1 hypothetical protein [Clostridioides sp. ZZV14-5902]